MGSHASSPRATGRNADVRAALDALRRVVQGIRSHGALAERATGLTGAQLFVLQQLAEAPAQSLNELAVRTRTHQSSVSTVVTRLVARRLVSRRRSAEDGRRLLLEVTQAGRALLTGAPETAQSRLIAALDTLPPARRRSLARELAGLATALGMDREPAALLLEPPERPGTPGGDARR
jgi:DNA-binding MarR family transcriptional regulator